MEYLEIANSPLMWCMCLPLVVLVMAQVVVFARKTIAAARLAGISKEDCMKAFRTGMISAIGPSAAVFIVMVGLMSVIGAPMSWMRLSVIGSAEAELLHAGLGASAVGQSLGGAGYDSTGFSASIWAMSTMSISWLIMLVFIPQAAKVENAIAKKDGQLMQVFSTACMIGIMTFMSVERISAGWDMAIAAIAAAGCMLLLSRTAKRAPFLKEYHLGISMLLGMLAGTVASIR